MSGVSAEALCEIFLKIVDAAADRQSELLRELCPDDETRAQVAKLLEVDETADPLLDHELFPTPIELKIGDTVSDYTLVRELAYGGMGIVFLAEQVQPIRREVALKVIKPGVDTREVIARFNAERQALSLMDHPNIAKVLDAGATESGRPFFVMELVNGKPITAYCQQNRLSIEQRLQLFSSVCHAIQHAHHKGIIHRDIKPSNVMVAEYDGYPVAKVIDFGVAKAISQMLTPGTIATGIGQILGTFDYMSPEQARLNANDIDTRSDIYSLGVLLYELLSGTPPFDHDRLRSADFDEMLKILREEDPPQPSLRLEQLQIGAWSDTPTKFADHDTSTPDAGETKTTVDSQAKAQLRRDARHVRGELDWIVMKAMDKDRNRRYSTPDEMAADVERFLAGEAVSACPPSSVYRLRKFASRNKVWLATSGLVSLSILFSVLGIAYQTVRASRAKAKADTEAFEFLIEDILGADLAQSPAGYSPDPNLKYAIVLKNAKDRVEERFASEPELLAKMKGTLADMLGSVGEYQEAAGLYEEYYGYLKETRGHADPDTLRAMRNLVRIHIQESRFEEAAELCDVALGYSRLYLGQEHALTLGLLDSLAMLHQKRGENQKALETYLQVLDVKQRVRGELHWDTLATKSNLAIVYDSLQQFDKANVLHNEVLNSYRETLSPFDVRLATAQRKLGRWHLMSGRRQESELHFEEAANLLREALEFFRRNRGPEHTDSLETQHLLAQSLVEIRQLDDALPLLEDLARRLDGLRSPDDRMSLEVKKLLGWTYMNQSQLAEAEYVLTDALEQLRRVASRDRLTLQVMENLAITQYRMGKTQEAVSLDEQTAMMAAEVLSSDSFETLSARARQYLGYQQLGQPEQARTIRESLLSIEASLPEATQFFRTFRMNPSPQ